MNKFEVWIMWGESEECHTTPTVYKFNTEGERTAFCYGLDESLGWNGYTYGESETELEENYDANYDEGTYKKLKEKA